MLGFDALGRLALGEVAGEPQTLTPSLYSNTQTFQPATVNRGVVNLTPALYSDAQGFHTPFIAAAGAVNMSPPFISKAPYVAIMQLVTAPAGPNFWSTTTKGADISVSSDGSTATQFGGAANNGSNIKSLVGHTTGIRQFSITISGTITGAEGVAIGFGTNNYTSGVVGPGRWPGGVDGSGTQSSIAYWNDGIVYLSASTAATYSAYVTGDTITCWVNYTTPSSARVSFRRNSGNWNNNAANDPAVGYIAWPSGGSTVYALIAIDTNCSIVALNPGWF